MVGQMNSLSWCMLKTSCQLLALSLFEMWMWIWWDTAHLCTKMQQEYGIVGVDE